MSVPDYSVLPQIKPITRIADPWSLSAAEFRARFNDAPVVLEGAAKRWPAFMKWTPQYINEKCGDDVVTVRTPSTLGLEQCQWSANLPLRAFAQEVSRHPGLYLAQWYIYRRHPEMFDDIGPLPEYLDDDWLSLIPRGWALHSFVRNNAYWGAAESCTDCHFDNLNAVTWNACIFGTKRWLLFSGRPFPERSRNRLQIARKLVSSGLASQKLRGGFAGFVTVEGVEKYFAGKLNGLPPGLEFSWADVGPGDIVYVPWRWFHQVHNVTESLAVSRYYISEENYHAGLAFMREVGAVPSIAFRSLLGARWRRRFLANRFLQELMTSRPVTATFQAGLRLAGLNHSHFAG